MHPSSCHRPRHSRLQDLHKIRNRCVWAKSRDLAGCIYLGCVGVIEVDSSFSLSVPSSKQTN